MTPDVDGRSSARGVLEPQDLSASASAADIDAAALLYLDPASDIASPGDHIRLSPRASMRVSAGLAAGACVLKGIEHARERIELDDGRVLTLDGGIYFATRRV